MEIKVRRNLQFALLPYLKMNPLGQAHVGRRRADLAGIAKRAQYII
jgi:hypothetical protein